MRQRYNAAIRQARAAGVITKSNVRGCCNSCITHEKLGLTDENQAYAYTFGGQGMNLRWSNDGDVAYVGRKSTRCADEVASVAYWKHGNGSAERVAQAFRDHGFTVDWDGTSFQSVMVQLAS